MMSQTIGGEIMLGRKCDLCGRWMQIRNAQTKGIGGNLRIEYECRCGQRTIEIEEDHSSDFSPFSHTKPKKKKSG